MMSTRRIWQLVTTVIAAWVTPFSAVAETNLSMLNGEWRGSGTDRKLPIEFFQQTRCQNKITSDQRHLNSEMVCEGEKGLRKVIRFAVTMDGDQFTGTVGQTATRPGDASPFVLNGSVSGQRAGDSASFQARWPGLLPNASIVLTFSGPSSYSMHVSSLGVTITDVTFNRISKR